MKKFIIIFILSVIFTPIIATLVFSLTFVIGGEMTSTGYPLAFRIRTFCSPSDDFESLPNSCQGSDIFNRVNFCIDILCWWLVTFLILILISVVFYKLFKFLRK